MTSPTETEAPALPVISALAPTGGVAVDAPTQPATRSRLIVGTANSENPTSTTTTCLPIIRIRTRKGVPLFDRALNDASMLSPQHVVFDRLAYTIDVPIAFPTIEAFDQFVETVADPTIHVHALWRMRTTRPKRTRGPLRVKLSLAPGWHLHGGAELRLGQRPDCSLLGRLTINIDLNFGRWAGALSECDPALLAEIPATELLRYPRPRRPATLDGNDNVLPNRNRIGSPSAEPRVTRSVELMDVYLGKVEELLRHFLIGRPDYPMPVGMQLTVPTLSGASYAEAYLEFHSEDAIAMVERLRGAAIAGMSAPEWQHFPLQRIPGTVVGNSPSVTIPLTKTVGVTAYAKFPTTVRLEARYRGDIREHAFHRHDRGRPRTAVAELAGLRHDAAGRISTVLHAFAAHLQPADLRKDGLDLLHAVYQAVGQDVGRARVLLTALVNLGGITVTNGDGIAPPDVISFLERAGVVHRVPYRHGNADPVDQRRYALTPAYAAAI